MEVQGPAGISMFHVESVTTMKAIWCLWKQRAEDHRLLFPSFCPQLRSEYQEAGCDCFSWESNELSSTWDDVWMRRKMLIWHQKEIMVILFSDCMEQERWFPVLLQFPLGWVTIVADCSSWRALNLSQWDDLANKHGLGRGGGSLDPCWYTLPLASVPSLADTGHIWHRFPPTSMAAWDLQRFCGTEIFLGWLNELVSKLYIF